MLFHRGKGGGGEGGEERKRGDGGCGLASSQPSILAFIISTS